MGQTRLAKTLDLSRHRHKKTLVIYLILLNFLFSFSNADPDPSPDPNPDPDPSPDPMPDPNPDPNPNPDPDPSPTPIMTFPESGVYSLFPHEDLKTGKNLVRFDEDRNNRGGYDRLRSYGGNGGGYGYGGGRPNGGGGGGRYDYNNDRDRDRNPSYNRNFFDNMRNRHSRVFFDEERHRFMHNNRPPPFNHNNDNNRYLPIGSYSPNYPVNNHNNGNRPPHSNFHGGHPGGNGGGNRGPNLISRPISPLHHNFQQQSPYPPVRPQSKLPVRASENEVPTRIHIFNPESHSFGNFGYGSARNSKNNFIETGPPGPDLFLNHEEYLNYHTKLALARLDDAKKNGGLGGAGASKEEIDGKKILYDSKQTFEIDGLVPPNASGENKKTDNSDSDDGKQKTKILSVEVLSAEDERDDSVKPIDPSAKLSDKGKDDVAQQQLPSFVQSTRQHPGQPNTNNNNNNNNNDNRRQPNFSRQIHTSKSIQDINGGFEPIVIPAHLRGAEIPRTIKSTLSKADKSELGTEVSRNPTQSGSSRRNSNRNRQSQETVLDSFPKLRHRLELELQKKQSHDKSGTGGATPAVSVTRSSGSSEKAANSGSRERSSSKPQIIAETVSLSPEEKQFFSQFSHEDESLEKHFHPADSDVPEGPTLIFLESSEKVVNNSNPLATSNLIKVMRVKTSSSSSSTKSTISSSSAKGNTASIMLAKTGGSSHESKKGTSKEALKKFTLKGSSEGGEVGIEDLESSSSQRIVEKVHAHISHCPKLHAPAEVICDVHIRERHGNPNPQLIVGWRRKFHNETHPDVLLALNKTLAYDDDANNNPPAAKLLGGGSAEDFHDKFNVTLAPGISPMLRSVLLIRSVTAPDCGNYQCEVFDGKYTLKSETLLFLCH